MKPTNAQIQSIPFKYAAAIKSGDIISGKKIQLAVDRFYSWLDTAEDDGFYLDHKKGMHIIKFFETFLKHTKGEYAGKAFVLSPFQQFTLYNIYGWLENTTHGQIRRINQVYEKVAKKNGKTAVMAGAGLYGMSFDLEYGAEIYVGATKEDQAKLCFNQAVDFISRSSALKQIGFTTYQKEIKFKKLGSTMRPLGGDSKTQDGINAHYAIIDEYHAHKDDSVKENLESSMASRTQPLVYHITTAGVNLSGVCKQYEDSVIEVLEGRASDNHLFIMMHDLDDGDDWELTENWQKANPNLGISVNRSHLIKEYNKAKNQPSKIPNFKTKHLNMWVDAPEIWIPTEIWRRNKAQTDNYEALFTQKAQEFGAFTATDLSTRIDLSAHIVITEPDLEGNRYLKAYFYCPAATIDFRSKEDRVPYRYWADAGYITATSGDTIDYDEIRKTIHETNNTYNVETHEFDSWNASNMVNDLQKEGVANLAYFSQAISIMSYPTKQFEILVTDGNIKHDGNPVLEWMLSGCVLIEDPNENIKVHKGKSHRNGKRVDGIIAAIMALGGSLSVEKENNKSKYNDPNEVISFGV